LSTKNYILAALFFLPSFLSAQIPFFRHYTSADGLANTTVYNIMQDSKGFVWFCTEAGVNRFDGHRFETFTTADGLADNENFKTFEDSKGRIWFFSYNGKLSYLYNNAFVNEDGDPSLKYAVQQGKFLVDIVEDREGHIWFSTFQGGVFMYDNTKVIAAGSKYRQILKPKLFCDEKSVYTIGYDNQSNVLYDIKADTTRRLKSKDETVRTCRQILRHAGVQYIVTDIGLEHITKDSLITDVSNRQLGYAIQNFNIVDSNLWLGTYGGGIFQMPDFFKGFFSRTTKAFQKTTTVSCIVPDNEGGVWVGTMSEGAFYQAKAQAYITNIPTQAATSIKHSKNARLWATGNYYGQLTIYNTDGSTTHYVHPGLPKTRIKTLSWLSNNRLLVGMDYTPYVYDLNKKSASFIFNTYVGITDLYDGTKALWLCGRNAIYTLDSEERLDCLYSSPTANAISDKFVSIVENDKEEGFFTSIRDLYKITLKDKEVIRVAGAEVFNSNLIDLEYANGMVWVATHGNGIFIFKDTKLVRHIYSGNSNITSDICQKLIFDKSRTMWLATNRGISVFDVYDYRYLFRLTMNDVLIENDVKDIDLDGNKAYVATPAGISIIDIDKFVSSTAPPQVYIRKMIAGTTVYDDTSIPKFKYFKGDITVSYSAITFQASQSVTYRYRIRDKDTAWYETANDRVTFHNMAPDTYTFILQAKKYNSDWSKPVMYSFIVQPLWFQYTWFKMGCILCLGVVIYAIYRLQIRKIEKREEEKTVYNKRIVELENGALASQMNPHFIFNSLNTIQQFVINKDDKQGLRYLSDFSILIRQILEYSKHRYIDLQEEISFLKRYLELEQTRFNGKFTYSFHLGESLYDELKIPPMLIQPLLENCIKHGFVLGKEHIDVSFNLRDEALLVVVSDNGIGVDAAMKRAVKKGDRHQSTALKVIESRLKLVKDVRGRIGSLTIVDMTASDIEKTGTCVSMFIPIEINQ
jgi:ligand-binding sensor domain-containing protein